LLGVVQLVDGGLLLIGGIDCASNVLNDMWRSDDAVRRRTLLAFIAPHIFVSD
jgi:hypothetical protein